MCISARHLAFWITIIAAVVVLTTPVHAQRKIEVPRVGSEPLNQNPAGRALGSGAVDRPDGMIGDGAMTYGNALDANLRVGSGGFNSRSARSEAYTYRNLQARNLVVTNGVTGGRGFRGDVGYLAPGDFAGETGGDSTYGFRRDSALSGLEFLSSSRQIDTFNIAQGMGVFQYRRDFTSLPEVNSVRGVTRIDDAEIRLDRANTAIRTGNLLDTAVAPSDIGLVVDADGQKERAMGSTLRGIQFPGEYGLRSDSIYEESLYNEANLFSDDEIIRGLRPERFVAPFDRSETSEESPDERLNAAASTSSRYDAIMRRVLAKYEDRDDVSLDISGVERLRDGLDRFDAMVTPAKVGTVESSRPTTPDGRRPGPPGERIQAVGLEVGPADDESEESPVAPSDDPLEAESPSEEETPRGRGQDEDSSTVRSVDELIEALAHAEMIETLVDPKMRARVQQIIEQGEAAMMEGQYFQAEDRFEVALQLNPGNPTIEGGLANAQIGAGLYRSAGVTLARLFRDHELMIDVQWEAGLIPNRTRLKVAASDIESMIVKNPGNSGALGLVRAYIGRQLGDETMISEGLDQVKDAKLVPLVALLRGIWLLPR